MSADSVAAALLLAGFATRAAPERGVRGPIGRTGATGPRGGDGTAGAHDSVGPWTDVVYFDLEPRAYPPDTGPSGPTLKALVGNLMLPTYSPSTTKRQTLVFHVPHKYRRLSRPTLHLHTDHNVLVPTGSDVRWRTVWRHVRGYGVDTLDPAGTEVAATQTIGARYSHEIWGDDDLLAPAAFAATIEPDSLISVILERDQGHLADDFDHDLFLWAADLHMEASQSGTTERNRPFTSGGW